MAVDNDVISAIYGVVVVPYGDAYKDGALGVFLVHGRAFDLEAEVALVPVRARHGDVFPFVLGPFDRFCPVASLHRSAHVDGDGVNGDGLKRRCRVAMQVVGNIPVYIRLAFSRRAKKSKYRRVHLVPGGHAKGVLDGVVHKLVQVDGERFAFLAISVEVSPVTSIPRLILARVSS